MGSNFVFGNFSFFLFLFSTQNQVPQIIWTELSDTSYYSPFSNDSNHIKKCTKFFCSVEKDRFETGENLVSVE